MSNSKRWTDEGASAEEMVPEDGFFLDGNAVKGKTVDAGRSSGAIRNETQELGGAPASGAATPGATQTSTSSAAFAASANDLAAAFWGVPETFPEAVPTSSSASPIRPSSAPSGTPIWSAPFKVEMQGGGADLPPMTEAPSFAPIPLRSTETAGSGVFSGRDDEWGAPPRSSRDAGGATERSSRRESPFKADRSDFGAPFDPFMGPPLGGSLGASESDDFFPKTPNSETQGPITSRSGSPFQSSAFASDPTSETSPPFSDASARSSSDPSPIWATPGFDDLAEEAERPGHPEYDGMGGGDEMDAPHLEYEQDLPGREEDGDIAGAEILPWPGRGVDAPIPVMGVPTSSSTSLGVTEDLLGSAADRLPTDRVAAVPFDPSGSPDLLAEAVQSALRNVYGEDPGEEAPAQDRYMSERGLLREGGVEAPDSGISGGVSSVYDAGEEKIETRAEDWFGGRFDHQPASFVAEPTTEAATEAVLHYLYGQTRREEPGHPEEYGSGSSYGVEGDSYNDRFRTAPTVHPSNSYGTRRVEDSGSYGDPSTRRHSTLRNEPTFRPHPQEDQNARFNVAPAWEPPQPQPQPQNMPVPVRQGGARLHAASTDVATLDSTVASNAAFAEKDSGRLLGVAGLGLIGGITLTGILAVFVFNSFVTDGGMDAGAGAGTGSPVTTSPRRVVEADSSPTSGFKPARADTSRSLAPTAGTSRSVPSTPSSSAAEAGEEKVAALPVAPSPVKSAPVKPSGPILVSDAAGPASGPIPISLSIASPAPADAALVSIRGLPEQARLSGGIDVGGGRWLLPPQKLDGLALSVPPGVSGEFKLEAQLMASDVRTPVSAPAPFTVSITGSAFPPIEVPAQPQTAPTPPPSRTGEHLLDSPEMREFLQDGNKLMREGDILGARKYYDKVASTGSLEGYLAMGRSYDPSYYENLPVKTGKPDPAQAFEWYKKALEGGLDTARVKIDNLKQWLLR